MGIEAADVHAALAFAVAELDLRAFGQGGQKWLKPTCVRIVDVLIPRLDGLGPHRPFICMNSMTGRRWPVRQQVRASLVHADPYDHECLVDINVMVGDGNPYRVLLTAESEGYPQAHHRLYGQDWPTSDYMWDLYKLLQVPSPVRLFVTLTSSKHHDILAERTDQLVSMYQELSGEDDIWAVQFPTASMQKEDTRVLYWPAGAHDRAPCETRWRMN